MEDLARKARAVNEAARALGVLSLTGMTHVRWVQLTAEERVALADTSGLNAQLTPFEGMRVEVYDEQHSVKPRRFIVSRSTGWHPCHIELHNITSTGGVSARDHYHSIRVVNANPRGWPRKSRVTP